MCKALQSAPQVPYIDEDKKVELAKDEKDAEESGKMTVEAVQDDAAEVLRNMQFKNMSGCTF